jgi:putative hemolysin
MGYDFARASVEEFEISVEQVGRENLPEKERLIFASNHPLGGFDGMLLISLLSEKYRPLKVLVNDILTNIKNMDEVFVPINKHGRQSAELVRKIDGIFASDSYILTFPAGYVSRRKNGIIRDPDWQKNFISKAVQHKRDIVPIFVSGRCTNRFYTIARLRSLVGIRANLEMFFLPDESYRHRRERIRVIYGKPIPWQTFDKSLRPAEWALKVQDHVYRMGQGYQGAFNA